MGSPQLRPAMPFRAPTRLLLAPGVLSTLPVLVSEHGLRRVLLVTDVGVSNTGAPAKVAASLAARGVAVEVATEVEANPRLQTAEALGARARGFDGVIGLGGGSVLDAAKAAAMLATNGGRALDYVGRNKFAQRPLRCIAIPTTCGTGSEVTWVSVLTDPATKTKVSIKGDLMFPDAAVVDADLIASLPQGVLAATAVDALTHALEATTGLPRNPVSDALAEKAIALAFAFLPRASQNLRGDAEAREAIMRASTLAGLAFGNADVGAVHCLSETLGGFYDVPHGLANAVLLVPTLAAHGAAVADRLAQLDALLHPEDPEAGGAVAERAGRFLASLRGLLRAVSIPSFASLGIAPGDHARIARTAVTNGSNASNPRPMGEAEYGAILRAAHAGE